MMEYMLVHSDSFDEFAHRVNQMISIGWIPCGGASISETEEDWTIIQGTTKEKDDGKG